MKLLKGCIVVSIMLLLFSCATTEDSTSVVEKIEAPEESNKTEEKTSEKKMIEVEIEEIEYFIVKNSAFYGDGQIDTITNYTYDDNYTLLKRIQINEQEEVLETSINEIVNGRITKQLGYGFANALNMYIEYKYDSEGNIIEETLFDKEEKVQSISQYEFENNKVVLWKTLSSTGGTLAITTYEYDSDGNNIKINMKDSGGSIDGVISKMYTDGVVVKEEVLDSKGTTEKVTEFLYDNGKLKEKIFYDEKGKKKRSEVYEYTEGQPVPSRINYLYKSGGLESYSEIEYLSKTTIRKVMVEE